MADPRPALRIRRYGDNIEVLVRYDMRGKGQPGQPDLKR